MKNEIWLIWFSGGARDNPVKYGPIAPPSSKMSRVQPVSEIKKKVWLSWDSNPRPLEVNLVHFNEKWMSHVTNLIKAALLVCSFPLALSFEIIWLYFCWCFKLKIANQNTGFKTDQSETGTYLISRSFFVYSILAWARSVKNFPSLKKLLLPFQFRFSHVSGPKKFPDRVKEETDDTGFDRNLRKLSISEWSPRIFTKNHPKMTFWEYGEYHEMPQKACEGCIFHVRSNAFYFEMHQIRTISISVHFSFKTSHMIISKIFSIEKWGISKKRHVTSFKARNEPELKLFEFGAFQNKMHLT